MKVLVRYESEKPEIGLLRLKTPAEDLKRAGVRMLESSAVVIQKVHNKGIVPVRYRAEYDRRFFDDFLHVGAQLLRIVVSLSIDGDEVRNLVKLEAEDCLVSNLDRAIHQGVEVRRKE